METTSTPRYQAPGWLTRNVMNRAVAALTGMGVGVYGARSLEVPGRISGRTRSNPVNLLRLDGAEYLVAARGTTEWVRNVRAADGALTLRIGRRRTTHVATEVTGPESVTVLRAYLQRWRFEVGMFFGAGPEATDAELAAIVPDHPTFRLAPAA